MGHMGQESMGLQIHLTPPFKLKAEVDSMICSFLIYWAGLLQENKKQQIIQGVEVVKTMALFFHKQDLAAQAQEERQLVPYVG
jgi:hypothetical protein